MGGIKIYVLLAIVLHCDGVSISKQLSHIARRYGDDAAVILGSPTHPSHLPRAEAILPGHTLIRPALGMLKSSVKFPHREQESGFGVNGNVDNLGIRFDGKNERVLYSGFRRAMPKWSIDGPLRHESKPPRRIIILRSILGPGSVQRPKIKAMSLKDFLRMITSLRREQEIRKEEPEKPFKIGRGSFPESRESEEERSKTQTFWDTKGGFEEFENRRSK